MTHESLLNHFNYHPWPPKVSSPELVALTQGAHHLLAGKYFQLAAFVMLIYDHLLTFPDEPDRPTCSTMDVFVRDGSLYFLVIVMTNMLNTLIYFLAENDLKATGASFSQLITAVMVSCLVLNLRSSASAQTVSTEAESGFKMRRSSAVPIDQSLLTRTIGDLGEDIESKYAVNYLPDAYPANSMALGRKLDLIPPTF